MYEPDYNTERKNAGFSWSANATYYTLLDISGISLKEFNINPDAGIELFKKEHREAIREIYGEGVGIPGISTPSISYGHVNGLGIELIFPDDGEVNYVRDSKSIDEWIEILKLKKGIDFSKEGMAPFYLDYKSKLEKAYPGESVGFSYGYEGPITTAYEIRDSNVFYDPYDEPEKFKEFLEHLTDSIIDFVKFYSRENAQPAFSRISAGMCDDIAALFSPSMWEEFILPYWNKYYSGLTSGKRCVHCEDLTEGHMYLMEKVALSKYDPGISHKLSPEIICKNTRVPFEWRMGSFHIKDLEVNEIEDWVYKAVADGTSCVFTTIVDDMLDDDTVEKVKIFIKSSKNAEKMLKEGISREKIGDMVSYEGREKFWNLWPRHYYSN
ncbi:MAG TPA: hypothetical protein GX527_05605 [Clostridiaceae bacterium]|jgi:hypothetical protein|nr:hypothetical protein [Clostridiaceae bacterium]